MEGTDFRVRQQRSSSLFRQAGLDEGREGEKDRWASHPVSGMLPENGAVGSRARQLEESRDEYWRA